MGNKTKIDWCDSTWNPVTGCLHNCGYCYARDIAKRFGGWTDSDGDMHNDTILKDNLPIRELDYPLEIMKKDDLFDGTFRKAPYPYGFMPTLHRYKLGEPQKWKKGRNIFVCSMADLMGAWIPEEWKHEVIKVCDNAPQHNYLFLTKNPLGYMIWNDETYNFENRDNFWLGLTFTGRKEDIPDIKRYESGVRDVREEYLYKMSGNLNLARHKFLSIEPIMCDVANLHNDFIGGHTKKPFKDYFFQKQIDYFRWVIVGAETGRRKDKIIPKREWIENLVELCREKGIPIFMKESLADTWGEPLIQEFPKQLKSNNIK